VEVNVPGVIAILVAPVVTQFSVLLVPELMLAATAVKEVIVGAEPGAICDDITELQPASATQANRISTIAPRFNPEACSLRELSPVLQNEPAESIQSPLVVADHFILATPPSSQSLLQAPSLSQRITLVMPQKSQNQRGLE
jgi:hypothetical protein